MIKQFAKNILFENTVVAYACYPNFDVLIVVHLHKKSILACYFIKKNIKIKLKKLMLLFNFFIILKVV